MSKRKWIKKGYKVHNCCVQLAYEIVEELKSHQGGICKDYEVDEVDCIDGVAHWIKKRITKDDSLEEK